jgi:hypothetical protein
VITGAFLAEAAAVVDNKLDVSGGVLSRLVVGPVRSAELVFVVLTQAETDGPVRRVGLTVRSRRVEVEISPRTDDEPLNTEYELPESAVAGEIGFAFSNIEVWLPVTGRWVFVVTGGAGVVSLALVVRG